MSALRTVFRVMKSHVWYRQQDLITLTQLPAASVEKALCELQKEEYVECDGFLYRVTMK